MSTLFQVAAFSHKCFLDGQVSVQPSNNLAAWEKPRQIKQTGVGNTPHGQVAQMAMWLPGKPDP
jgi:hypothetical protein